MCIANRIDTNTVVVFKQCFDKFCFDESMNALEDWELFLNMACDRSIEIMFDPKITAFHFLSKDSISKSKKLYFTNWFFEKIDYLYIDKLKNYK